MRSFMILSVGATAALRAPIVYPFPDLAGHDEELMTAGAPAETAAAPTEDAAMAPWHAPTMKPEGIFASTSTDAFKHPTAEMVKDWETAPKVEMFETPTMKPMQAAAEEVKAEEPAPEVVKSKIVPVDPYVKKDADPELAAIQQTNPMAYGIVKALLMKKAMGLPMPGASASAPQNDNDEAQIPSSSGSVGNMWNWKPEASASDEMAAVEETSSVSKRDTPEESPEPAAEPEVAEAPIVESAPAAAAAPAPESRSDSSSDGGSLGSWLSMGSAASSAPAPVEAKSAAPQNALLSKYAMDLSF